jgi:hypothetical protein
MNIPMPYVLEHINQFILSLSAMGESIRSHREAHFGRRCRLEYSDSRHRSFYLYNRSEGINPDIDGGNARNHAQATTPHPQKGCGESARRTSDCEDPVETRCPQRPSYAKGVPVGRCLKRQLSET